MSFLHLPVEHFLEDLASSSPTPGGGGAAALAGATAAALVSMVCRLTLGRPKYAEVETRVREILTQSEALREELTALIDVDADAYGRVMAAYRLPRETEEERQTRSAAIEQAMVEATRVLFRTAAAARRVLDLSEPAAEVGNVNALGDIAVAVLLADAVVHATLLQSEINLRLIKDRSPLQPTAADMAALAAGQAQRVQHILTIVRRRSP
jgi:formiminotetrahydrofolate cyclodeaminase